MPDEPVKPKGENDKRWRWKAPDVSVKSAEQRRAEGLLAAPEPATQDEKPERP